MNKYTVTSPNEAYSILRKFRMSNATDPVKVPGTRAKFYTMQQIQSWFQKNMKQNLEPRWFGRALNAAIKEGKPVKTQEIEIDGKTVRLYNNSR